MVLREGEVQRIEPCERITAFRVSPAGARRPGFSAGVRWLLGGAYTAWVV